MYKAWQYFVSLGFFHCLYLGSTEVEIHSLLRVCWFLGAVGSWFSSLFHPPFCADPCLWDTSDKCVRLAVPADVELLLLSSQSCSLSVTQF